MTTDGTTKDDVKVPEGDLGDKLQAEFDEGKELGNYSLFVLFLTMEMLLKTNFYRLVVTIVAAMGEEYALSYKDAPK